MRIRRLCRIPALLLAALLLVHVSAVSEKSILLTFTGDCTIGSEEEKRGLPDSFDSVIAQEGMAYPFANFRPLFEQDDCTVINLESVLSDSKRQESKGKTYRFRGNTDFVRILTEGSVEAAGLSNNHTGDYGAQGLQATKDTLDSAGIAWFMGMDCRILEKDGIRIALFSMDEATYNGSNPKILHEMRRMKEEGEVNAIVFCLHSGREYTAQHYKRQEVNGNTLPAYGADLVIMNHPHVVQGIRIVCDRTVCYSLGNFVFGGNSKIKSVPYGKRILTSRYSLVVQARLDFSDDGVYLGQQVTLYPAFTSDDPEKNHYQPYPVHGEDAAAVLDAVQFDTEFELPPVTEAEDYPYAALPYLPASSDPDA